ncbi:MAG: YHS domain-containing (seleno)protein [Nitrospira sp.]
MRSTRTVLLIVFAFIGAISTAAFATDYLHSTPGLSGYDPVAYFSDGKPIRGSGYHEATYQGVTYVFTSEDHKKQFLDNPEKYLPAYGAYCAYGVARGKKFVADPEVWKIVEGILYLNLDKTVQQKWEKDISAHIKKADANWPTIKDKAASDL